MAEKAVEPVKQEEVKNVEEPEKEIEANEVILPPDHVYPKNLVYAVLQVMNEVRNIEKNLNVATGGTGSYKGVSDKDVKYAVSAAMVRAGLIILPHKLKIDVEKKEWTETDSYNKLKQKTSYFTKIKGTYKLMHVSGETAKVKSTGHGQDSQDKSAGKAMTYALKYALLYTFLIATGTIDDSDKEHSDSKELPTVNDKPVTPKQTAAKTPVELPWLDQKNKEDWEGAVNFIKEGKDLKKLLTKKRISKANQELLLSFAPKEAVKTPEPKPVKEELPWLKKEDKENWDTAVKYIQEGKTTIAAILLKKQMTPEDKAELTKFVIPVKKEEVKK